MVRRGLYVAFGALLAALLAAGCASSRPVRAAGSPEASPVEDSLTPLSDGAARLLPVGRIEDERIDESSGLAYVGGFFWTLNDSGGDPVLFRSTTPQFEDAVALEVPGATNVDWEELAVLDGDLLVCDVGDNRRQREDIVIYRVRPVGTDALTTVATYPLAYPDGKHDAEGVYVWNGVVHVVLKNRGEDETTVFRFPDLRDAAELGPDRRNVGERAGAITIPAGEQVTAAAVHSSGRVALLTYSQVLIYPAGEVRGAASLVFGLHARQCEALCFVGDTLVFDNEQRDVYSIEDVLDVEESWWLPPRTAVALTRSSRGDESLSELPLTHLRDGEFVRLGLTGDELLLDGRFLVEGQLRPTDAASQRVGTAVLVLFGDAPRLRVSSAENQFAVVADESGAVTVRRIELSGGDTARGVAGLRCSGAADDASFRFTLRIDVATIYPEGLPDVFLLNVAANGMREGPGEPILSGFDFFSLLRPFMWAGVSPE